MSEKERILARLEELRGLERNLELQLFGVRAAIGELEAILKPVEEETKETAQNGESTGN